MVPVIPDNPPPNWRAVEPTGKIPVLQDGDFTLADSAAICAYLERKQPQPSLYPSDIRPTAMRCGSSSTPAARCSATSCTRCSTRSSCIPRSRASPPTRARIDDVLTRVVPEVFGYLDSVSGERFLAGDALSVADLAVMSNLVTMQYIGFALERARFPRLAASVRPRDPHSRGRPRPCRPSNRWCSRWA